MIRVTYNQALSKCHAAFRDTKMETTEEELIELLESSGAVLTTTFGKLYIDNLKGEVDDYEALQVIQVLIDRLNKYKGQH